MKTKHVNSYNCPLPPLARYYNSDLSIWLSVDPLVDKYPNLSPYTYCAGNPVKLVDPDGEELCAIENIYSTQRSSDFNLNISSKESFLGGDPPRWWQTVKNACSTVGTGIVNGLEAADKFSQSDIVGRVAGAISQINPLVSLTNAAVTIVSDHDMFGKPVTTYDKITSGISAGFTVASEAGIILKEAKYIPIETGKYITTGYSVLTIGKSENETTDEKQKKIRLRFIIIMLSVSMLSAIFTASMIYFFQVKNLPSHNWNYIKDISWSIFLTSMIAGFAVAIQFYDNRKQ